jgi:hypothetical protein
MNILNKQQNLESLFDFQKNDQEYKEYKHYLNYYYQKPTKQDKYDRSYDNGKLLLINKKNPQKKIEITPARFGDLEIIYEQLKMQKKIILEKISIIIEKPENYTQEDRDLFDELKEKYGLYNQKIIEIDAINKHYYVSMEELLQNKIKTMNQTALYYMYRTQSYQTLAGLDPILKSTKAILIKLFHEAKNQIPPNTDKIAKQLNIPSQIIDAWFNWIQNCYYYLKNKKELYSINDQIDHHEAEFETKNKYMLLKKPHIKEIN